MADEAHILAINPSRTLPDPGGSRVRKITSAIEQLAKQGGRIEAVVLLGLAPERGQYSAVHALVDDVMTACLDSFDDLPPLLAVPGQLDLQPIPKHHQMASAMTDRWAETARQLWAGQSDDVVEDLQRRFSEFLANTRDSGYLPDSASWRPGLLPGDGSLRLDTPAGDLRLVVLNTVFRMLSEQQPTDALAVYSGQQILAATGGTWDSLVGEPGLTVLLCAQPGPLPRDIPPDLRLLGICGNGSASAGTAKGTRWLAVDTGHEPSYRFLRIQSPVKGSDAPRVRDLTASHDVPLWNLSGASTGQSATASQPSLPPVVLPSQPELVAKLRERIASGQLLLVVVSGLAGHDRTTPIGIDELKRSLSTVAFGQHMDPEPGFGEIWPLVASKPETQQVLDTLRSGPKPSLISRRLLGAPWSRIYDFTGSDALTVAAAGAVNLRTVDATTEWPRERDVQRIVAMWGRVDADPPTLDFNDFRTDSLDSRSEWYSSFFADAMFRPVVLVSETPNSPELWKIVNRIVGRHEDVPAFLITPKGTDSDEVRLNAARIWHIHGDPEQVCADVLNPGDQAVADGLRRLAAAEAARTKGKGVSLLAHLVDADDPKDAGRLRSLLRGSHVNEDSQFLRGEEPTWNDIKHKGFAADLSLHHRIMNSAKPGDDGREPIVLVEGRAGSGKTTALMQAAFDLHRKGKAVGWVDRDATLSKGEIEKQARDLKLDAVFVDDVDFFQSSATSLLRSLNQQGTTLVVAAIRNTRRSALDAGFHATPVSADVPLTDGDLEKIIKVLKARGLLGELRKYQSLAQRIEELRKLCERNLLAAMIQIVTGQRFEDKLEDEFMDLTRQGGDLYAERAYSVVCLLDSEVLFKVRGISEVDLADVISEGKVDGAAVRAVQQLVESRLLVQDASSRVLYTRHRVLADYVLESILKRKQERLELVMKLMLTFYAVKAGHIGKPGSPYHRVMVRLLNHSMLRDLALSTTRVRHIYESGRPYLDNDLHYWLQRAQFELEHGEVGVAKNHLQSAQSCIGGQDDYMVRTAWGQTLLTESTNNPRNKAMREQALDEVKDLDSLARQHRGNSPQTFAVLARSGTKWLEACGGILPDVLFFEAADLIGEIITLGRQVCGANHQFLKEADEYEPKLAKLVKQRRGIPL